MNPHATTTDNGFGTNVEGSDGAPRSESCVESGGRNIRVAAIDLDWRFISILSGSHGRMHMSI